MNTIDNDMRSEYDPSLFDNAEVGKYAQRLNQASNVVVLAPDVSQAFPNAQAVNDALRQLLKLVQQVNVAGHAV
jgi:hypothetical protein